MLAKLVTINQVPKYFTQLKAGFAAFVTCKIKHFVLQSGIKIHQPFGVNQTHFILEKFPNGVAIYYSNSIINILSHTYSLTIFINKFIVCQKSILFVKIQNIRIMFNIGIYGKKTASHITLIARNSGGFLRQLHLPLIWLSSLQELS